METFYFHDIYHVQNMDIHTILQSDDARVYPMIIRTPWSLQLLTKQKMKSQCAANLNRIVNINNNILIIIIINNNNIPPFCYFV